jgi:hypothetical protein
MMPMRLMRVYISGPITGCDDINRPAFDAAEKSLKEMGYEVINPLNLFNMPLEEGSYNIPWEGYMRIDIKALCDCDAIYQLAGWENSRGATLEAIIASALDMRIIP